MVTDNKINTILLVYGAVIILAWNVYIYGGGYTGVSVMVSTLFAARIMHLLDVPE